MKTMGAIILAGGKSSRMGEDKAFLDYNGSQFLKRTIELTDRFTDDVMVVGHQPELKDIHNNVVQDVYAEKGPIGGIYTGLLHSKNDESIVLACDYPLLEADLLQFMIDNQSEKEVNILMEGDRWHPLIGIYSRGLTNHFENCIEEDLLKVMDVLSGVSVNIIEVPEAMRPQLANINYKEDYQNLTNEN